MHKEQTNRFMELEGLRVVAAIVVVLYHAALIFYPSFFYGLGSSLASVQNSRFEDNLYQNPLAGVLSGTFAVGIFFVLSGFVLSVGFFQKRDPAIIKKLAAKRYLRLMLPALASILLVWGAVSLGWTGAMAQTVAITHSGWLAGLYKFIPDFFTALHQGVISIFTTGEVYYNPVLWTIRNEFIGSFIVFGSLFMFSSSRYRWVVYAILISIFSNTWFLGFVTGMVLSDIYVNYHGIYEKLNNKFTYLILLAAVVLGGYPAMQVTSPIYLALRLPWLTPEQHQQFYVAVGATILILGILSLSRVTRFFAQTNISRFGRYTYSLYLIHMPVLFTVCTGSFVLLVSKMGFHLSSVVSVGVSLLVIVGVTYLFEKFIDAPSIRFASYCTNIYLGKSELRLGERFMKIGAYLSGKITSMRVRLVSSGVTNSEIDIE